ncbi:MAG: divergent polysaccharide deacetylase family protein [Halieaceae bacterium]|nr:divergent polysaccharide deacetylase family protein [Halieaceae bacterium]
MTLRPAISAWLLSLFCCVSALARAEAPVVVIIIDDLGYELRSGEMAASLPGKVNLAILPHTPNGAAVARMGLAAGKEIMLHAPMANLNKMPLGAGGLTAGMSEAELRQTLADNLASTPGVRGINNHMGSLLTARSRPMSWVMEELSARGLYFVDSRTTADTVAGRLADQYGVPHLERHVFLDNEIDSTAIHYRFKEVLATADAQGLAVAIGHPHEATLKYLRRQLRHLEHRGYRLALVSEVLTSRTAATPRGLAASGR